MYRKLLSKLSAVAVTSVGGASIYCYQQSKELKPNLVHNSTASINQTVWDDNWDHRGVTRVKPAGEGPQKDNKYNEEFEKHRSKAIRHIILVRHGQYVYGDSDKDRVLTELGRAQAKLTGERLAELKIPIDDVVISTMTRAQETGNIIIKQLPRSSLKIVHDPLIEEGAPVAPVPKVDHWTPDPHEFFQEGSRIEAGFRAHVHRAEASQEKDSHTLMVCHGNVIRYFVCRALQFPPEAWLRFNLHHASITWLVLYPNGRVVLRLFGDCGHMPKSHVTLS